MSSTNSFLAKVQRQCQYDSLQLNGAFPVRGDQRQSCIQVASGCSFASLVSCHKWKWVKKMPFIQNMSPLFPVGDTAWLSCEEWLTGRHMTDVRCKTDFFSRYKYCKYCRQILTCYIEPTLILPAVINFQSLMQKATGKSVWLKHSECLKRHTSVWMHRVLWDVQSLPARWAVSHVANMNQHFGCQSINFRILYFSQICQNFLL